MPKRHSEDIDVEDLANSVLNIDRLLELDCDERAAVLVCIADRVGIPTAILEKARTGPPFSASKWPDIARQYGLHRDAALMTFALDSFKTPKYYLPLSLHVTMFENAWCWKDVYCERSEQSREEVAVRILDPVCQPSNRYMHFIVNDAVHHSDCGIISRPGHQQAMQKFKYSTGGGVGHWVSTWFNVCG
jgi:hypothetical protein